MKDPLRLLLAALLFAAPAVAVDPAVDLSGTWKLDLAHSDLGGRSSAGVPGRGGRFPGADRGGLGLPGEFPGGAGRRGGGFPGGGGPGGTGRRGGAGRGTDPILAIDLALDIEQSESAVTVTRRFTADGGERRIVQTFPLDGTLVTNPAAGGRGELRSRVSWKKSKLVNVGNEETRGSGRAIRIGVKEEFSLSNGGRRLVLKTTRSLPRGEMVTKHVFNREAAATANQ